MSTALFDLKHALAPLFQLETMRNGKYIYPEIQTLFLMMQQCEEFNKVELIELLKCIRNALVYIEKWRMDFKLIQKPLSKLVKTHQIPLKWDVFLAQSKTSLKFQFSALNHHSSEMDLIPWLQHKEGWDNPKLSLRAEYYLVMKYRKHLGFSQKLSEHLNQDPHFLRKIIMDDMEHFVKLAHCRLVLYLTDVQIAEAIVKYHTQFLTKNKQEDVLVDLVTKLNSILSNGRSISTVMRSVEARFLLENIPALHQKPDQLDEQSLFISQNQTILNPPNIASINLKNF